MLTQIQTLLDRVEAAESVEASATLLLLSFKDTLASLRAQLAQRGDPTAEIDLAIANLDKNTAALAAAIKANTDAEDEHVPAPAESAPAVVVDPNTVPAPTVATPPAPDAPAIVDPNTAPAPTTPIAATEPPQGETSAPVLDVAPEGQTSEQLNASGAVPSGSEPAPVEALEGG